mmetsp:Transcript_2711/g.2564  ORF Transcript_2711/g.2564 Transcript_2711/m.2564 type:complete len:111 (+) Transcript_2711:282-614(+)
MQVLVIWHLQRLLLSQTEQILIELSFHFVEGGFCQLVLFIMGKISSFLQVFCLASPRVEFNVLNLVVFELGMQVQLVLELLLALLKLLVLHILELLVHLQVVVLHGLRVK